MPARLKTHSPLVVRLAAEVRAKDATLLDETIHDIFSEQASSVNNQGVEQQIEWIIKTEGSVDKGVALVRGLIEQ